MVELRSRCARRRARPDRAGSPGPSPRRQPEDGDEGPGPDQGSCATLALREETEPGGSRVFRGGGLALPEEASDRACAALSLATLLDRESEPAIRELAREADRAVLQRAIEALAKK